MENRNKIVRCIKFHDYLYIIDESLNVLAGDWYGIFTVNVITQSIIDLTKGISGYRDGKVVGTNNPALIAIGISSLSPIFVSQYELYDGDCEIIMESTLDKECWDCHNFGDAWLDQYFLPNVDNHGNLILHTSDGMIYDEIPLGKPQPCVLTPPDNLCKFTEQDMLNALRAAVFSPSHANEWLKSYMMENNII